MNSGYTPYPSTESRRLSIKGRAGLGILLALLGLAGARPAVARTVHYELTATRGAVNLSGRATVSFALQLNGSIPAPTLEFTEGDTAEIVVRNQLPNEELSIHWHGLLLPPEMDGVSYVNTPPILPGQSFTFRFRIRQHGTYWYHSHTNVQEQKGLYGAFIIHPRGSPKIRADREIVAVLSDWSDEDALDILKNLRKDGDYYLYKKDTVRSWLGAIQAGELGTYLENEWTRMGGMDLSDVGYDAFLINGKRELQLADARAGERIRVRLINAAASTYFSVSLGQAPMRVISADGVDIAPAMARNLLLGMAETYDLLFTVPEAKNYELRVTAQDGTGAASGWIGAGPKVAAPRPPLPDLYAPMNHGEHAGHADDHAAASAGEHAHHAMHDPHAGHASSAIVETLTVDSLRAPQVTKFPASGIRHDVKLVLDGDMKRYIWHLNGRAIHQERTIEIQAGDVIRFTFVNQTMMHHPMHLHGHFFRVLNAQGDFSPLKHTVDVPPHGTRQIEFLANEPGEWMLHCHNLYHLKTGMARVVKYSTYTPSPEIAAHQKHDPHLHDHWYTYGMVEAASNHGQAYFRLSSTWDQIEWRTEARNSAGRHFSFSEPWEVEGDLFYRRWLGKFVSLVGGATYFEDQIRATAGASYTLPLLFEAQALIDHRGQLRLDLEKRFQWTRQILTDAELTWRPHESAGIEHPLEFEVTLMYAPQWAWAAGFMLTDHSLGVGVQAQF